ncbi:MAG: PDZ domain-containing protein [Planctomycetes bacterium]|nr:PDZ domain-containing protein [Planctomycetota bacterium]
MYLSIKRIFRAIGGALTLGMLLLVPQSTFAQKTDKKEPPEKKPAVKVQPKKAVEPVPFAELTAKLKEQEDEIAKIRKAMLRAIREEEKLVAEELQKARDAQKAGDRKAFSQFGKLQSKKFKLQQMRFDVERRFQVRGAIDSSMPVEQRLGVFASPPATALRAQLGLAKDVGLILNRVTPNSAAAKAGLKEYDILLQIGPKKVTNDIFSFRKALEELKVGASVEVIVLRQGKQETIKDLTIPDDVN